MTAPQTIGGLTLNNNGTLTLGGSSALTVSSTVTVGSGQALQGAGTMNAAVTVSGGTLGGTLNITGNVASVGGTLGPASGGTLAIGGSLASDSNSTYNFAIGTTSSSITAGSISGTLAGSLSLAASGITGVGSYNVIAGSWGVAPSVALTATGTGLPTNLLTFGTPTASATAISVPVIRNTSVSGSFYWAGGSSGNWSTATWNTGSQGGTSYTGVYPGQSASDTAAIDLAGQSSPTITMDAPQTIAGLTISNNGTLTFNGSNALTVSGTVTVGSGQTLQGGGTMNAAVALSGGTLAGTLNITGNVSSVGGTLGPVSGGTLAIGGSLASDSNSTYNFTLGTGTTITAGSISGTLAGTVIATVSGVTGVGSYNIITPPTGTWAAAPTVSLTASGTGLPTTLLTFGTPVASTSAISVPVIRNTSVAGNFYWANGSTGAWSTATWNTGSQGGASYTGVYPGQSASDTVAIDLAGQSSPTITMDAPRASPA